MQDAYLGTVVLFAFNYAPQNWLPCDGQLLPVDKYQALFAVIGNKYGGDYKNFALPNLKGKSPSPEMGYYICVMGIWPAKP